MRLMIELLGVDIGSVLASPFGRITPFLITALCNNFCHNSFTRVCYLFSRSFQICCLASFLPACSGSFVGSSDPETCLTRPLGTFITPRKSPIAFLPSHVSVFSKPSSTTLPLRFGDYGIIGRSSCLDLSNRGTICLWHHA